MPQLPSLAIASPASHSVFLYPGDLLRKLEAARRHIGVSSAAERIRLPVMKMRRLQFRSKLFIAGVQQLRKRTERQVRYFIQ